MKTDRLVVRLTRAEKVAISRLAALERLPSSTLARRLLLREAERQGLLPDVGYGDSADQLPAGWQKRLIDDDDAPVPRQAP